MEKSTHQPIKRLARSTITFLQIIRFHKAGIKSNVSIEPKYGFG
jgi:hypothetical protein